MASLKQIADAIRLREIEALFDAAPPLSTPRKNPAGNTIEWANSSGLVPGAALLTPVSRNTIAEHLMHEFTLPADFLTAPGQHIEILIDASSLGSTANILRVRLGGLTGTILMGVSVGGNNHVSASRRIHYLNSAQLRTPPQTFATSDFSPQSAARQTIACDWSQPQTFAITFTIGTGGQTVVVDGVTVRAFR